MPIPVINYSAQQPQGYPAAQGLMEAIMQGLQLGQAPKNMQAEQERQKLANALSQMQLKYAPEMNEQKLQGMKLENQYYPQNMQSQIDYRNLQAELMPQEMKFKIDNADRLRSRFDYNKKLFDALETAPKGVKETFYAQNPEMMAEILSDVGNQAYSNMGFGQAPGTDQLSLNDDQIRAMQESGKSNYVNDGISQAFQGAQTFPALPVSNAMKNKFAPTEDQINQLKLASEIAANKQLTTTATQGQLEGAIQLEEFVNSDEFMRKAKNASQYAGALGKGKAATQRYLLQNPEALMDYDSFRNHDLVGLQARFKQLEGMGSSDSQKQEIHDMTEKTMEAFNSNPEVFMKQLDNLKGMLRRVAESVEKSSNPLGFESRLPQGHESKTRNRRYNFTTGKLE